MGHTRQRAVRMASRVFGACALRVFCVCIACNGPSLQVTYQKGTVGTLREEEIIGNPRFAAFVKEYPWVFVDEANQEMEAPRAKKVSAKLQKEIDAEIAAGNAEIIENIVAVTWKPCVCVYSACASARFVVIEGTSCIRMARSVSPRSCLTSVSGLSR